MGNVRRHATFSHYVNIAAVHSLQWPSFLVDDVSGANGGRLSLGKMIDRVIVAVCPILYLLRGRVRGLCVMFGEL